MTDKQTVVRVGDQLIDASSNSDDQSSHEAALIVRQITYDGFAEVHHRVGPFAAYVPIRDIDGDGTRPWVRFHIKREAQDVG
jgi:hypothetical protein